MHACAYSMTAAYQAEMHHPISARGWAFSSLLNIGQQLGQTLSWRERMLLSTHLWWYLFIWQGNALHLQCLGPMALFPHQMVTRVTILYPAWCCSEESDVWRFTLWIIFLMGEDKLSLLWKSFVSGSDRTLLAPLCRRMLLLVDSSLLPLSLLGEVSK